LCGLPSADYDIRGDRRKIAADNIPGLGFFEEKGAFHPKPLINLPLAAATQRVDEADMVAFQHSRSG